MTRALVVLFFALMLAGCGDSAEQIYENARFEEQQFNEDHARKLYRRILEEHPDSPYAARAQERLAELER